jgi:hypothetical protein
MTVRMKSEAEGIMSEVDLHQVPRTKERYVGRNIRMRIYL